MAAKKKKSSKKATSKKTAKKSPSLRGLSEYGGNMCSFVSSDVMQSRHMREYPASRNGWRSAVHHAFKATAPGNAMYITMRCSDTPKGDGIAMAQCYYDSERQRVNCTLEGSGGPEKYSADRPDYKYAVRREETSLAGVKRKMPRAPRRVAAPSANSMASRFLRSEGFDDILEWKAGNTSGMMPLMDTPYHSKAKDIAEACAAKKKGEYEKVWRVDSNGRQEICMAPLAGLTKKKVAKKSKSRR